ncbi:tereporin-Ca1 [Folsomia candida]|uniref:Conoporin-Cn1 n=1 Tax=Folsomia candida TaxID=158441 RepID=A0A226D6W2_FOLCA|nr:tereporin-Ca1 [Folsomia candida]XP_035716347.1 tereporin-Ca1 [Folsomia candida]OXA40477.1 Conoporin-Cn1 [Folsomia candida]
METVLPIVIPEQVSPPRGRKQAVTKSPSFLTTTFAGHTMFGGNTAEIISNGIRSNRTCTIQISNHLSVPLTLPHFYCFDGGLYYPLPAVIQPGTREACVFSKNPSSPHGVIGVLTYQIGDSPRRVAVMFSVAYNQLQYRNHFGTAIVTGFDLENSALFTHSEDEEEDEVTLLFDRMYQDADFYQRGGRAHSLANDVVPMWTTDGAYQIRGTMSDRGKAIVKLNISLT